VAGLLEVKRGWRYRKGRWMYVIVKDDKKADATPLPQRQTPSLSQLQAQAAGMAVGGGHWGASDGGGETGEKGGGAQCQNRASHQRVSTLNPRSTHAMRNAHRGVGPIRLVNLGMGGGGGGGAPRGFGN